MKTVVILPTYNEAQNLSKMIPLLQKTLPAASLLVVDDNSPDGTGKIASAFAEDFPQTIRVLHRPRKEGLGKAYIAGFRAALDWGADQILQMDCDFSHPVSLLPSMVEQLKHYDFVLPSRYIPGGGVQNWEWYRRLLSWGGNFYARLILGSKIRDLTGGFKGFNRHVVEFLLQCPLDSSGYSFQVETTSYAVARKFSYIELPFVFSERESGVSKMSRSIILEAFLKIFRLRKKLRLLSSHLSSAGVSNVSSA